MAIYQMSEMGLLLAEEALDQERAIAVAWFWITGAFEDAIASKPAPTGSASTATSMHNAKLWEAACQRWQQRAPPKSSRSRQRLKTEITLQRLHQFPIFRRRSLHNEPGVVMQRRGVFMAPHAIRGEVDDLLAAIAGGDFQMQLEIHANHHGQMADQHQPVCGHVAEKTDGLVGNAIEHSKEIRQLMPFNPAVGKHAQFAMQGSVTEPHLCFGTCLSRRPALPASGVTVATSPSPDHLPVAGVAPGLQIRL